MAANLFPAGGMRKKLTLLSGKNYLLSIFSFLRSPEGDGTTSPSFTTVKDLIDGPSASLEALIVTWCKQWGCKWEQFTHGKQIPVCQSFAFCERRGRRGNVALFYNKLRADPSFQRIDGNGHFSLVRSVGMQMRTVYPRQTNTCLPIFSFLRAERAMRRRHPLLQLKCGN